VPTFDDTPRSGMLVVRDGTISLVSEGAARILGRTVEELQRTPFIELFAPEERERVSDRYQRRMRGEPVPSDYEAEILRVDGSRATLELHVDREGHDVVVHYRDISLEMSRRQRLQALATLGAEIQRERTEAQVLGRLRADLPRLGLAPMLMQPSPAGPRVVWSQLPQAIEASFVASFGRGVTGFVGRWSPFSRKVWEEGAAFTDDWGAEAAGFVPEFHASRAREVTLAQQLARAIAVRIDERPGARFYLVLPSSWLRHDDLAAARLFAAQVAAALDAASAIAELSRRLSDLTALHALTGRIFANPAGDVTALLGDGCRETAAALSCPAAVAFLVEDEGTTLRAAARAGEPFDAGPAFPVERDRQADEAIRTRAPAYCADVTREPSSALFGRSIALPATLAVPIVARDAVRGVLYLADHPGRTFADADRALAQALAGELAVGLENAELYAAAQAQVRHLSTVIEVSRVVSSTLDLEEVLAAGAAQLEQTLGAAACTVLLEDVPGPALRRAAHHGPPVGPELVRQGEPSLAWDALAARAPVTGVVGEPGSPPVLAVPLHVRDRALGVALVAGGHPGQKFTPGDLSRATAIASQLAIAVDNARLYEDLRVSYEQLAGAQRQLIQKERLAALGELSAVVAHEVRNPLGVIFNSLGSLRRLLHPTGDARLLLDIVGEEADRLNRIVGDLLDFARPITPVLQPGALEAVVDEAVAAALAEGTGVVVDREAAADLPRVPMDARLVRQAVLNLAANAIQAMPRGGWLRVRMRAARGGVLLELEDTGPGIPDEIRARIFEPFFTTKAAGTGLGLAVVKRIVELHGGEITISRAPGGGTLVQVLLPAEGAPAAPVETKPRMG
jgi:PAS domain S-box-containing protein